MTKPNFTSINVVLDRSGSMQPLIKETLAGFNTFLADQKKQPGEAVLTLATFANDYTLIHDCVPIQDMPELTTTSYQTGGYTALLDAIARTMNATGDKLAAMKEEDRPSQVLLVIITDGEENSSREFAHERVMSMIKHQQDVYKWSVVYLGSSLDAVKTATRLGMHGGNASYYQGNSSGVLDAYASISSNTSSLRSSGVGQTKSFFSQAKIDDLLKSSVQPPQSIQPPDTKSP
jgi:uncharacterized protein YegL